MKQGAETNLIRTALNASAKQKTPAFMACCPETSAPHVLTLRGTADFQRSDCTNSGVLNISIPGRLELMGIFRARCY
ncbi:hypothetical protein QS306_08475 [Paraburkholderia bonniea]|uniref:hypothetical protein n=1 Tax=Paraburkholderia bonniea TaxID=2152891 RepID=UPI002572BB61|nr:hypothetical protein [Paraburkholderia bonniea]WJF89176.1 hypothetical protein QS306_08475 [Paraburkholderia bonniea]WJF92492.1 hypothetical protein QS308_08485 [Paraburkholderia bonniea]